MPIPEDFRESMFDLAKSFYSPGENNPISHAVVKSEEDTTTMISFTCDVEPSDRTDAIRECCAKPGIILAGHAFEAFGIKEEDKTEENLAAYGPTYWEWPDHLRLETLNVVIESRDGNAEFWQAPIQGSVLGEFESANVTGHMTSFFPHPSILN